MKTRTIVTGAAWILGGMLLLGGAMPRLDAQPDRAPRRDARDAMRKGPPHGGPRHGVLPARKRPRDRGPAAGRRPGGPGRGPGLVERLMRMPAPERQRFLRNNQRFQRLPRQERKRIQKRLHEFYGMNPNQRELMLERYAIFQHLPRHKRQQARGLYRQWTDIPQPRRRELLDEIKHLRHATPDARRRRFADADFAEHYTKSERRLLKDLTDPTPGRPID